MTIVCVNGAPVMYFLSHAAPYLTVGCQVAERPHSDQIGQSEITFRHGGKDPVIKFSFDDKTYIALWSKVADDESWANDWACVCAHVVGLFQLSEVPEMEMMYIDDDGDEIMMLVGHPL